MYTAMVFGASCDVIGGEPMILLERAPRGDNAQPGERRVWTSGIWEKQPEGSDPPWRLVKGYRRLLRKMAGKTVGEGDKKRPAGPATGGLSAEHRRTFEKQGTYGCPSGQMPNPTTGECIKVTKLAHKTKTLLRLTKRFSDWHDWYERSGSAIETMTGIHRDLVVGVLAATSQATETAANVTQAFKALRIIATTPPGEKPKFVGFMEDVAKNLDRLVAGEELRGPKIGPYHRALGGDPEAIAVDRHIGYLMFNTDSPNEQQKAIAKAVIRKIAKKLGIEPRGVQAAMWALSITNRGEYPESYDVLLKNRQKKLNKLIKMLDKLRGVTTESIAQRLDILTERLRTRRGRTY